MLLESLIYQSHQSMSQSIQRVLTQDVASTVQIMTVRKIQNSKQLLQTKKVVIAHKQ